MKKKILFITHQTSKTGAPLVLLFLMKWIRKQSSNIEIHLHSLSEGIIKDEFKNESDHYYPPQSEISKGIVKRLYFFLGRRLLGIDLRKRFDDGFYCKMAAGGFDLIYANSVVSAEAGVLIKKESSANCKLIVHVHELETIIATEVPDFKNLIPNINRFIAVSNLVRINLVENHGISDDKIDLIHECADPVLDYSKRDKGENKFIAGASGSVNWRKGDDVFIQVARYIENHFHELPIYFIWVGGVTEKQQIIINEDLKKLGIQNRVKFVGEQLNPFTVYNDFDVFLLTSREDPFPLVCIELGMMGKPIICFDNASGISEVIKTGGGFSVPYLNIEQMAEKIVYYFNNTQIKNKDGEQNKEIFSRFTPEKICPLLFDTIEKEINAN